MKCPICQNEAVLVDHYYKKTFAGTRDQPPEYEKVWEEFYCDEDDEYFTEWY